MADEPERPRSQYPPPDDPNRGYYPQAPRDGNSRDDKNTYPAPEDPNRAVHYQQGSPAAGPPRDDRMPYPADPSRQPQYPYDPRAGQYQPPQHQWNGQYPPPQYPVSPTIPYANPIELANPSSGSYSSRLSISSSCKSRWPALCPTSRCISPAATISWTWLPIPTSTPLRRSPSTCTTSAYGYCLQILSQEKGQPCNISEIISA
jgi:hypothetical protein